MNNTCVILVLTFAFVSCALSSYLDIPAPPERPMRFKTKEQIENYLKAIKDYYDAFKVKLVRRDNPIFPIQGNYDDQSTENNDDGNDLQQQRPVDLFKRYYDLVRRKSSTENFHHRNDDNNFI